MRASRLTATLLAPKGSAEPSAIFGPAERPGTMREPIVRDLSQVDRRPAPANTAAAERIRLSVRMDAERHRTLKLIAAHTGRSLQDHMLAALDAYVEGLSAEVRGGYCLCLNANGAGPRDHSEDN